MFFTKNTLLRRVAVLVLLALVFIGFKFVTQSGQQGVVIQNDGYAGTGGAIILVSGYLLGLLTTRKREK